MGWLAGKSGGKGGQGFFNIEMSHVMKFMNCILREGKEKGIECFFFFLEIGVNEIKNIYMHYAL